MHNSKGYFELSLTWSLAVFLTTWPPKTKRNAKRGVCGPLDCCMLDDIMQFIHLILQNSAIECGGRLSSVAMACNIMNAVELLTPSLRYSFSKLYTCRGKFVVLEKGHDQFFEMDKVLRAWMASSRETKDAVPILQFKCLRRRLSPFAHLASIPALAYSVYSISLQTRNKPLQCPSPLQPWASSMHLGKTWRLPQRQRAPQGG